MHKESDNTPSFYMKGTLAFLAATFLLFGLRYYFHECALTAEDSSDYRENLDQSLSIHKYLQYDLWAFLLFQLSFFFRFLGVTKSDAHKLRSAKGTICFSAIVLMFAIGAAIVMNWSWP